VAVQSLGAGFPGAFIPMTLSSLPLSYCTNVHPGRTVAEVIAGVQECSAAVARELPFPMAAGLWLAAPVVQELQNAPGQLELLAQTLWENDLSCYTLNTFPFGDFHSDRVKENVYLPDWADPRRAQYTEQCAEILAALLPEQGVGSLSTLPLGGRMNAHAANFEAVCFAGLIRVAKRLQQLESETGRRIRLAVEPEPLCELSGTSAWTLPVFERLFRQAEALNCEPAVREYIGLCFDVCHQAVEFEDVAESMRRIAAAGIRINKIHITNAIELRSPRQNSAGLRALQSYAEPRYLHQTSARFPDGTIRWRTDLLAEDLHENNDDGFLDAEAWRIHFHVPVDARDLGPLLTTRADLEAALRHAEQLDYAPHLEVETYTWPVMPGTQQTSLPERITREMLSAGELLAR
jgi:sugar phosphate isomerase/epimerase